MKSIKTYITSALLLVSFGLFAQYTDVINSNRPGVSRSAFSVGTNVIQLEAGPYIIKEKHTPLDYKVSGFGVDFAARYGLLWEPLEINIEGTYQRDKLTNNRSAISTEDKRANFKYVTIGAKYLVYDPYKKEGEEQPNLYSWKANHQFKWKSLIPAVSVYLGANFDSKNNPYTAPGVEGFSPKAMVATQNNFSSGWVFVTNFILDRIGSDQSDFSFILTLTKAINEQWVVFGETQGIKSDFYADNLFRFGGAYLWSKDLQLDTALTFNTKDTPSVFSVNFGVSYRLDFHKDKEQDNGTSAEEEGERRANRNGGQKQDNDFD
ncbi:MAG: transporter [Mangrovimonas sp.]|nr:transporter [Mangrovimonas sp.]HPF96044.1 transporter [Mangrovimonas sp.]